MYASKKEKRGGGVHFFFGWLTLLHRINLLYETFCVFSVQAIPDDSSKEPAQMGPLRIQILLNIKKKKKKKSTLHSRMTLVKTCLPLPAG